MAPAASLPTRRFTSRSGATLDFTIMGFGTAPLGNLYRALSETEARQTLDAAWEVGCRYFDTAPLYGLGLSETRLNGFLREHRDPSVLISTKVGRYMQRCAAADRTGKGKFFDTPSRREVYDYSYDGVMRALEQSFERLGVDSIDILFCHDVDIFTHGSKEASDARIREFMEGGYKAVTELRAAGAIKAIGAGINEWQVAETMARAGDFDLFLLAGRYTLLEQEALKSFLPYCAEKNIGIVLGGPYNSGILATGPRPGAFYNYDPAPPEILARVEHLQRVCRSHGIALAEAALAFPLAHPAVVCVIPGGQKPDEMHRNAANLKVKIPVALWADLKAEGLLRPEAPVPV